jgi:hypothetical protein
VRNNDLCGLSIKPPDYYTDGLADGRIFAGSKGKSQTAHIWVNKYSIRNEIHVKENEIVVDEGKENMISIS